MSLRSLRAQLPHSTGGLWLITVLIAIIMVIDGYDLQIMALLIAPLAGAWQVPASDFGIVQSAAVGGLGAGAALLAPLGDRFGRRRVILAGFALITIAMFGSSTSQSLNQLLFWRLLTGLSLGGTLVNASALLAELVPKARRSLLLTLAGSGITVGAMLSGAITPTILRKFGWQEALLFSAVAGAIFWGVMWLLLPEAPSKLATNEQNTSAPTRPLQVLQAPYLPRTLCLWLLYVGNAFLIYLLASWLPVLMQQHGWDIAKASSVIVYFQGGGLLGGLLIAGLMDRWNPYYSLLLAYALTSSCFVGFSLLPDEGPVWALLFMVIGAGISGVHMTMNAIAAFIYPSAILATGMGFTVAVTRLGAVAAPMVGAALIAQQMPVPQFMLWQLLPIALCTASVIGLKKLGSKTGVR